MQFTSTLSLFALVVMQVSATPVAHTVNAELEQRQTASGCYYFSAPRCCVPAVCQCSNGAIYQINQDNLNNGRHGCDPPWGYISAGNTQFPGYCCRLSEGQQPGGITGDEALQYLSGKRFDLGEQ